MFGNRIVYMVSSLPRSGTRMTEYLLSRSGTVASWTSQKSDARVFPMTEAMGHVQALRKAMPSRTFGMEEPVASEALTPHQRWTKAQRAEGEAYEQTDRCPERKDFPGDPDADITA
jgi:predicted alpha/beta hydrolase